MEYEIISYDVKWDEYKVNVYRDDGTLEIANNTMDGQFIRETMNILNQTHTCRSLPTPRVRHNINRCYDEKTLDKEI